MSHPVDVENESEVEVRVIMQRVAHGELRSRQLITHRFALKDIMRAYDTFGNTTREKALKVILANRNRRTLPPRITT